MAYSKRVQEAVEAIISDLRLMRIDYARPTVHWADAVGEVVVNNLNSLRDDKRVSKVNIFDAFAEFAFFNLCHADGYATAMVMKKADDMLWWLKTNGYLSKSDCQKLTAEARKEVRRE